MSARPMKLKQCDNCKQPLVAFIDQMAQLRFCGPDCCNQWSAKQCAGIMTADMIVLINQVDTYLKAVQADQGQAVELGRLAHYASKIWPEWKHWPVNREERPAPAVLPQGAALAEDTKLQFP